MGRPNIVATTIKEANNLPPNLLADEKHTWVNGEKLFAATTVAGGCILGVGVAQSASTRNLTDAYCNGSEGNGSQMIKEVEQV